MIRTEVMRVLLLSALFAFVRDCYANGEGSGDPESNCLANQATMNECAEREFDNAEQAMKAEIEHVRSLLADSERLDPFNRDIEAWQTYRDAHCLANNLYLNGSLGISTGYRCRIELTNERTNNLRGFAAQLSNEDKAPYAAMEY